MQDEVIRRAMGQKLRTLRLHKGMTQEALARRANLKRVSISNIESGRQSLSLPALYALSYALGVEANFLLPTYGDLKSLQLIRSKLANRVTNRADLMEWVDRVVSKPNGED